MEGESPKLLRAKLRGWRGYWKLVKKCYVICRCSLTVSPFWLRPFIIRGWRMEPTPWNIEIKWRMKSACVFFLILLKRKQSKLYSIHWTGVEESYFSMFHSFIKTKFFLMVAHIAPHSWETYENQLEDSLQTDWITA